MHLGIEQLQGDLIKTAPLGLRQGQDLGYQGFGQFQGEAPGQPLGIQLPASILCRFLRGSGAGIALMVTLLVRAIGALIAELLEAIRPCRLRQSLAARCALAQQGFVGRIVPGPACQRCVIRESDRASDQDRSGQRSWLLWADAISASTIFAMQLKHDGFKLDLNI